eukprot:Seg4029.3 transcript_id=Seg4029.3/GoldUCD/mRNA.D3Y31 product="hypothetical protein" protein_id=Seg4029.3/GoldUCD/D3Y31
MSTAGSVVELKRKDRRLTWSDWFRKRKESLRDKCARYGLSITGKKAVLAERIYLYLHGEMATNETLEPEENLADTPLLDLPSEGFSLLTPVISTAQSRRDNRSHTAPSKLAELSCAPVPPHESDPPQSTSCLQPTVFASPPQATSTSTTPFQFPLDQLRQLIREEFHQQQQVNQIRGTTQSGSSASLSVPPQPLHPHASPQINIMQPSLPGQLSPALSLPPETAPPQTANPSMHMSTASTADPFPAAPPTQQQQPVQVASVGKNVFPLPTLSQYSTHLYQTKQ